MEIAFQARNMELTPEIREYAQKKLDKLGRHLRGNGDARVEFAREQTQSQDNRHVVQVTLALKGAFLRGEERSADVYSAIDAVANVMQRQVERYRGRHYRSFSRPREAEEASMAPQESSTLVRVKRHPLRALSAEDAAEQMELLGHDFFFFINEETQKPSVIYRRKAGGYGLIEPEA